MSASVEKQLGRRRALLGIGVVAAAAATVLPDSVGAQRVRRDERSGSSTDPEPTTRPDALSAHQLVRAGDDPADDDVAALFGDLVAGARIGAWRLEAVYAVRAGGIPVVLSTQSGQRFAVEVFRSGEGAAPLASAGPLALYLVNRGDGAASTDEAAGLGVRALGRALEARLEHGAPVPEALTTLSERRASYPTGIFHVPVEPG